MSNKKYEVNYRDRPVILDTPEQINTYALAVAAKAARMKADHGMQLTSRMPTMKRLAQQYGIEGVRTWAQLADRLEELLAAQKREMGIE